MSIPQNRSAAEYVVTELRNCYAAANCYGTVRNSKVLTIKASSQIDVMLCDISESELNSHYIKIHSPINKLTTIIQINPHLYLNSDCC